MSLPETATPGTPGLGSGLLRLVEPFPVQAHRYPRFRYMGSKHRLLEWIHGVLTDLEFDRAVDGFSGSGTVSYLLKAMGKEVVANDFLRFPGVLTRALVENGDTRLGADDVDAVLASRAPARRRFIERTFRDVFYTPAELKFLDDAWEGIRGLSDPAKQALALSALLRSCIKRQPRGVFTVGGDLEKYKDGRRDLQLSLREHFVEQVREYNRAVFDNGRRNRSRHGDVFAAPGDTDLVYLDPPYVPRSDDNCYVKRYHFLEGLACYWEGVRILPDSKVRKIEKPFTPFSYRRTADDAFRRLFRHFADATIVLSYSSNAYPDLEWLVKAMKAVKRRVEVVAKPHRYHFGTHGAVRRNQVQEYLVVGLS